MPNVDELEEPTPEEQARIDAATRAIDAAEELAVVPLVDKETGERELFLVAVRESDDADGSSNTTDFQPLGRLCDLNEVDEKFAVPEPLAAE